jgi:hypothetical protein
VPNYVDRSYRPRRHLAKSLSKRYYLATSFTDEGTRWIGIALTRKKCVSTGGFAVEIPNDI